MVGFYRKHVPNFSKIASPLTDLTRKNQAFKWMVECQQAFEELKTLLIKAPILAKAKLFKHFFLETDASQRHVAAVLLQYDEKGLPLTIGYYSKKLKLAEDREALAVVLACRHFRHYLWGSRFTIRTDHQPITSVFKQRTKSPRMSRWTLEMRDYHYKVEFKPGKKNVVADQLSRPVRIIREEETLSWLGRSKEEIREMQRTEPRWQEMIRYLGGDRVPRSKYPRTTLDQFSLEDEILYLCKRKVKGTILYLLVVPSELRKDALQFIHDKESGHLG